MVYPSVPIKVCKTIVNKLRICRIRCLHLLRPWLTLGKWGGTRQLQSTPKRSTNQCKPNEMKQELYTTWITWSSKLRNLRIWQGLDCESGGMSWNVLESLPFVWTTPLRSGPGVQTTAFWFEPVHPVLHCFIMFQYVSYWTHYQSLPAFKATSPSEFPTELNLDFEVMQPNLFTLQFLFRKDNHALLGQKKTHMAKTYLPRFLNLAGSSSQLEDHRILQLG